MRVYASLVLVLALSACGTSPALKNERVEFWRHKLAQDLHVGMTTSDIQAWANANNLRFTEQHLKGNTDLAALAEEVPGNFSLLTACKGWQILIYIFLDDSGRMTKDVVRAGRVCL